MVIRRVEVVVMGIMLTQAGLENVVREVQYRLLGTVESM